MCTAKLPPSTSDKLVTADELFEKYNHVHCDLIEGKVVEMAPPGFGHGSVETTLAAKLWLHVSENRLGIVATGETGFLVDRNPDTVLAADVAFVRKDRVKAIGITEKYFPEAPALAVEIVSPGDTANQVELKTRRWLQAGAELVWIVYPPTKSVTVYRSLEEVRLLNSDDTLDGGDVLPGFSVTVADLFPTLS